MKCLWIWAGSLSMPSSSCVLLLLNVDCCRCLYYLPFAVRSSPFAFAAGPCNSIHKQNFNFIAHSSWHSQQAVRSQHWATSASLFGCVKALPNGCGHLASTSIAHASRYGYSQTIIIELKMAQLVPIDRPVGGVFPNVYWLELHSFWLWSSNKLTNS